MSITEAYTGSTHPDSTTSRSSPDPGTQPFPGPSANQINPFLWRWMLPRLGGHLSPICYVEGFPKRKTLGPSFSCLLLSTGGEIFYLIGEIWKRKMSLFSVLSLSLSLPALFGSQPSHRMHAFGLSPSL